MTLPRLRRERRLRVSSSGIAGAPSGDRTRNLTDYESGALPIELRRRYGDADGT